MARTTAIYGRATYRCNETTEQVIDDVSMVLAVTVGFVVGLVGFGWVALQAARKAIGR